MSGEWLLLGPLMFKSGLFSFCCDGGGWIWSQRGSGFRPLCRRGLVGGWTAVLVQAHGAERVDRKTNLLTETHEQPVDLAPQLPIRRSERGASPHVKPAFNDF